MRTQNILVRLIESVLNPLSSAKIKIKEHSGHQFRKNILISVYKKILLKSRRVTFSYFSYLKIFTFSNNNNKLNPKYFVQDYIV